MEKISGFNEILLDAIAEIMAVQETQTLMLTKLLENIHDDNKQNLITDMLTKEGLSVVTRKNDILNAFRSRLA